MGPRFDFYAVEGDADVLDAVSRWKKIAESNLVVIKDKFELTGYKLCIVPALHFAEKPGAAFAVQTRNSHDKVCSGPCCGRSD